KSFDELCNLLQKQFAPRTSVFRKRIEFYHIKQNMGEPINNYYVRIKNAATTCKFGNRLNEVIKDRFICGLQPGPILDRICEEAETTPMEEILETALKKEATINGARLSLLPERVYLKHLKNCKLLSTSVRLKTYDGKVVIPVGEIEVNITYNDMTKQCKLIIVKNGNVPLCGRDLIELFNLKVTSSDFKKLNYVGPTSGLDELLEPLYKLLRVESRTFYWNDECQQSFLEIKSVISSNDSLTYFDPNIPIKLVCDPSNRGIGAVLIHVYPDSSERPISFASRTLTKAELGYSVIHKEALAVVWAVQKFSQYLVGRHFTLCTDHKPLLAIFGEYKGIPKMSAGRLQRWAVFLSEFDYTFKHIDGNSNVIADGFSRLPIRRIGRHTNDYDYVSEMVGRNPKEFAHFCEMNGILHRTSSPYHPATNGAAENAVKTFKLAFKKLLLDDCNKNLSNSSIISKYLFSYRNTPHCCTGETLSKLMLGRIVKTRLALLNDNVRVKMRERQLTYHHGRRDIESLT
ncbi:hypothetical protein ILUMI_04444, partial [Ignelater luminosus]